LADPQGYAVELYFDSQMEEQVRSFRESIYELGVEPVLGKLGDKPHISLGVFSKVDPEKLQQITFTFAQKVERFQVQLEAVGTFSTPDNVLFITPIPTFDLLNCHREFHKLLINEKLISSRYYLPDHWVPHCTLEVNLPDEQLDLAIRLCRQNFTSIHGWFSQIGVISYRPIVYLADYSLKGQ
jgi:2'-5' RNA ligase